MSRPASGPAIVKISVPCMVPISPILDQFHDVVEVAGQDLAVCGIRRSPLGTVSLSLASRPPREVGARRPTEKVPAENGRERDVHPHQRHWPIPPEKQRRSSDDN